MEAEQKNIAELPFDNKQAELVVREEPSDSLPDQKLPFLCYFWESLSSVKNKLSKAKKKTKALASKLCCFC